MELKKSVINSDYPYKRYVLCSKCEKPLYRNASRGHLEGKFPVYHCSRNHKYLRIKKKDTSEIDSKLKKLNYEMEAPTEKIKVVFSETIIRSIKSDLLKLDKEIKLLEEKKDKKTTSI